MNKIFISIIFSVCTSAFAISGACRGIHNGEEVVVNGYSQTNDPRDGLARVSVAGREVALFEGRDARINFLFQSARVSNAQGDQLEGKVTSLTDKTGVITRLSVPGYGIEVRNLAVSCWVDQ